MTASFKYALATLLLGSAAELRPRDFPVGIGGGRRILCQRSSASAAHSGPTPQDFVGHSPPALPTTVAAS